MKKCLYLFLLLLLVFIYVSSCADSNLPRPIAPSESSPAVSADHPPSPGDVSTDDTSAAPTHLSSIIAQLEKEYSAAVPKEWGEKVTGVKTRLDTTDKVIALTFDACGGKGGGGYDKTLIDYLISENVPATLFINSRWIDENMDTFLSLSKNNLFEIENHGVEHRPLSIQGQSVYGITGTKGVLGVIDEVKPNADKIYRLTGRYPQLFRSGTDYYDEIAVQIVSGLGEQVMGYSVLGDAGATYTKSEVKKACLSAKPGDIIIGHLNHPEKETAEGIMEAVPVLRAEGFKFVKLEGYNYLSRKDIDKDS